MAEKEYIEREAAIEAFDDPAVERYYGDVCPESVIRVIEHIPAADVRPVVLCRDCKNRFNYSICAQRGDDWFCGYGEKRE